MIRLALSTALIALAAVTLAACGGGGGTTTTSKTVDAPSTIKHLSNTGIPALDQVLDASLTPERIEMARLTGYHRVACAKQGDAGHPACRDTEAAGTQVEVLPKLGCTDVGFVRPEDVPEAYGGAIGDAAPKLTALYQPPAASAKWDEEYVAVLTTGTHDNGASAGVALHIGNGRIVALEDDCGDLLHLLASSRVGTWVIEPGGSGPAPTAAATATP